MEDMSTLVSMSPDTNSEFDFTESLGDSLEKLFSCTMMVEASDVKTDREEIHLKIDDFQKVI